MTAVVRTRNGVVTSYHQPWEAPDGSGRPVWVWRTDGPAPHLFESEAAAQQWVDEVFVGDTQKVRDESGWTIEVQP